MTEAKHVTPIFLISLPRSGSTLLQKMLGVSPKISTVAEPWILLPLGKMLERHGIVADYWQETCYKALTDLIAELPGGRVEFLELVAGFVRTLYSRIGGRPEAIYFLDKTPRYYLIVPFLSEAFPDAKFLFLFRNPIEVLTSILKTWHGDRLSLKLRSSYVDLVRGPRLMAEGMRLLGERALCVNYARLVSNPEAVVYSICQFLRVAFERQMITDYRKVVFSGGMGDHAGVTRYDGVSLESIDKWKLSLGNTYRKWYATRYVRFLGPDVLAAFELDRDELLREISSLKVPFKGAMSDAVGYGMFTAVRLLSRLLIHMRPAEILKILKERPILPYG